MKSLIAVLVICGLVSATSAQDIGWPREKSNQGGTIIYYQPQLDEWKDYRELFARMAVSVKPKTGDATVGVVYLHARTDTNFTTRNVVLSQI
jgi:tRNA(Met) C34 N-acetyltransferase TmcA